MLEREAVKLFGEARSAGSEALGRGGLLEIGDAGAGAAAYEQIALVAQSGVLLERAAG